MFKFKTLIGGALILSTASVFSAPNGKPFQQLANQIEANQVLIETNQQDIADLQSGLSVLTGVVSDIDSRLTNLAGQVVLNTADLQEAMARIDAAEGDIAALSDELRVIEARHEADITAIATAIAEIETDLAELAALSASLANELDTQIAAIRGSVDANSGDISAVLLDLVLVNGELASLNANYNVLQSTQVTLERSLNDLTGMLSAFDLALMELESRTTSLESFHIVDAVCGAAGELCINLPWVYVDVENGLAWAWASPCSGGCSQIYLDGRAHNLEGWRFASTDEWATRPAKTEFGGSGFYGSTQGTVTCAAPIFDNRHTHCDYSNNPVRVPDGGYQEQWVVHDLYTTP